MRLPRAGRQNRESLGQEKARGARGGHGSLG